MKLSIKFVFGMTVLSVLLIYIFVGTGGFKSTTWPNHFMSGAYNRLENAFLQGHTYLLQDPQPFLATWDMSFYQGKYYLYFGVIPVLLLYLPIHFLTNGAIELTDCFAVLIFCIGTFAIATMILIRMKKLFFSEMHDMVFVASLFLYGICNNSIALLHFPRIYEVAISGGVFFLHLAFWIFLKIDSSLNFKWLFLFGISLAFSVGCRATFLVHSLFFIGIFFIFYRSEFIKNPKKIAVLLLPFGFCMVGMLFYNYVRFDAWTDFGTHRLRTVFDTAHIQFFSLDHVFQNLFYYLMQRPKWINTFPFFILQYDPRVVHQKIPYLEYPFGIFISTPFVLMLPLGLSRLIRLQLLNQSTLGNSAIVAKQFFSSLYLPFTATIKFNSGASSFLFLRFLLILSVCGVISLSILALYPAVVIRYNSEFMSTFALGSCLFGWIFIEDVRKNKKSFSWFWVVFFCVVVWSIYMNLFISKNWI